MTASLNQFTAANQAFFEAQFAAFQELTSIATEGQEKLVALNLAAVKASAEETTAAVKELLAAKDPQALLALATACARQSAKHVSDYNQHLTGIVSDSKAEYAKVAEEQAAEIRNKLNVFVDTMGKNAPAGSENLIAILKSTVENANAGYKLAHNAAKQAVETTEGHVAKATEHIKKAVKDSTPK